MSFFFFRSGRWSSCWRRVRCSFDLLVFGRQHLRRCPTLSLCCNFVAVNGLRSTCRSLAFSCAKCVRVWLSREDVGRPPGVRHVIIRVLGFLSPLGHHDQEHHDLHQNSMDCEDRAAVKTHRRPLGLLVVQSVDFVALHAWKRRALSLWVRLASVGWNGR